MAKNKFENLTIVELGEELSSVSADMKEAGVDKKLVKRVSDIAKGVSTLAESVSEEKVEVTTEVVTIETVLGELEDAQVKAIAKKLKIKVKGLDTAAMIAEIAKADIDDVVEAAKAADIDLDFEVEDADAEEEGSLEDALGDLDSGDLIKVATAVGIKKAKKKDSADLIALILEAGEEAINEAAEDLDIESLKAGGEEGGSDNVLELIEASEDEDWLRKMAAESKTRVAKADDAGKLKAKLLKKKEDVLQEALKEVGQPAEGADIEELLGSADTDDLKAIGKKLKLKPIKKMKDDAEIIAALIEGASEEEILAAAEEAEVDLEADE